MNMAKIFTEIGIIGVFPTYWKNRFLGNFFAPFWNYSIIINPFPRICKKKNRSGAKETGDWEPHFVFFYEFSA